MKHNQYNKDFKFIKDPIDFNKYTERNLLQYCIGATLYMPGTKDISTKILNGKINDVTSIVMCFEDAIQEKDLPDAENNVLRQLKIISDALEKKTITHDSIPLIFLRVRNTEQFKNFSKRLNSKQASILSGFVFPKFYSYNAFEYLDFLEYLNKEFNTVLYGMPILEGKAIAFKETRTNELINMRRILKAYAERILNIRVGGTDFSALFGVRRGINYSIYDILTVRDCLSDILNFFNRDGDDFLVSAPVWEYFLAFKQDDINKLIEHDIHRSLIGRKPIINEAIDGLLKEVILDKANGFIGKTIIHPSHTRFVNALQAVTSEEYDDAIQIIETKGGVVKSSRSNKMNEINPHLSWAKKIQYRAKAYGVVENEFSFLKLIMV